MSITTFLGKGLFGLTITPKLRLSEAERKALLSCILKFRLLGISRMIKSTHIMLEPTTQALEGSAHDNDLAAGGYIPIPLTQVMIHPLVSLSRGIFSTLAASPVALIFMKPGRR